jgi:hypothetical protein
MPSERSIVGGVHTVALSELIPHAAYDLYSKSDNPPNVDELKSYYQELIGEYFDDIVEW